ncbi:MAG TPA: phosphate ABC transporter permease subunit PstC [Verrucomicrobiae bacterium]|jgi:phosphate transport system permease protein|nr:phosphate ABC transporter permease subunit PstC [Verrucomicrobiae bacterium]
MNGAYASATRATPGVNARGAGTSRFGDRAFEWLTLLMAFSIFVLIVLIGYELFRGATPAIHKFGLRFLATSTWDPVNGVFGALPFIFGTIVSSAIALLIAVPISIATAIYLTELAPLWLRQPLVIFIELLAAIPSVILGFWGFYVMVPWLHAHAYPVLRSTLGFLPFFQGPDNGPSILSAGIILAVMIIPIVTSVSREILRSVPGLQREAAYALGATRWEVTRIAVLSYAKRGLFGAVILGLGRALGETMAVTMLIGNAPYIGWSVFAAGQTLASVIANEFTEAMDPLHTSALFEVGLVLLGVTLVVNALARLLLITFAGPTVKPQH